jgi:hypothetical protein
MTMYGLINLYGRDVSALNTKLANEETEGKLRAPEHRFCVETQDKLH